jgi:hypothetical protein
VKSPDVTIEDISQIRVTHNEACTLQNQYLRIEFDDRGNLNNITNRDKNITVPFSTQGLHWYTSKYFTIII